jgi:hypothetical protein
MHPVSKTIFSSDVLEPLRKTTNELRRESRPPSTPPKIRRKKLVGPGMDLEQKIQELIDSLEENKQKNKALSYKSLKIQDQYIKKEKEFRRTLNDYEKVLFPEKPDDEFLSRHKDKVKKTHAKVLEKLDFIQHQTVEFLQEHEKLMVKQFNQELNNKKKESDENIKNASKSEVQFKKENLHDEIIKHRLKVELIEEKNNFLHKTNKELKIESKSYDNEVNILQDNLSKLKLQNAKLKKDLAALKEKHMLSKTVPDFSSVQSQFGKTERALTGKTEIQFIESLKRMIELEKKNLRAARNAYSRELQARNELESVIRLSIDELDKCTSPKAKIRRVKSPTNIQTKKDVLNLLYSKTFPSKRVFKGNQDEEADSDLLIEHLDKNIQNIEKLYSQHEEIMQISTERTGRFGGSKADLNSNNDL